VSTANPSFMSRQRQIAVGDLFPSLTSLGALGVLGVHFFLASTVSVYLSMMLLGGLTVLSFIVWPRFALCLLLITTLFQYFWIGVFMNSITGDDALRSMSLTNPLVTNILFICAAIYLVRRWKGLSQDLKRVFILGGIFTGICLVFAALGIVRESFGSAFQYFRNYSGALIYLALGAAFGLRLSFDSVLRTLVPVGVILALYGYVEMLFPYDVYNFVHLTDYFHMKYADIAAYRQDLVFYGIQDTINFLTVPFLNLSGTFGLRLETLRLVGPIFHFISYGYALSFFVLVIAMSGRYVLAALMMPVFLIIGAKGATVLLFFTLAGLVLNRLTRNFARTQKILYLFMTFYAVMVLYYGSISNDNHFAGLMSCLKGFLANPLGHGVGVGGNMSDTNLNLRRGGQDILTSVGDTPTETAIGVLMYQAGLAGLISFLVMWRFVVRKMTGFAVSQYQDLSGKAVLLILPIALSVLFINALFQEEAFTPTGWGLWLLLTGVALARHRTAEHTVDHKGIAV